MRKGSAGVEVMVGVLVLAGAAALFFLAMSASNFASFEKQDGYLVKARFDNIGGLKVRSPVTLAGVMIGRVKSIEIDEQTFEAVVSLSIQARYDQIPEDTFAKILTQGLLGEQYIGLDPGGSEALLAEGSEITITQSALVLEDMVGQFIFSKAEEGK
jgi:phospholipid/cholesterol/gamma-HCH transport system substrate-binding protein